MRKREEGAGDHLCFHLPHQSTTGGKHAPFSFVSRHRAVLDGAGAVPMVLSGNMNSCTLTSSKRVVRASRAGALTRPSNGFPLARAAAFLLLPPTARVLHRRAALRRWGPKTSPFTAKRTWRTVTSRRWRAPTWTSSCSRWASRVFCRSRSDNRSAACCEGTLHHAFLCQNHVRTSLPLLRLV